MDSKERIIHFAVAWKKADDESRKLIVEGGGPFMKAINRTLKLEDELRKAVDEYNQPAGDAGVLQGGGTK